VRASDERILVTHVGSLPRLSTEMEVGAQAVTPLGEGRGSGYPVRTPVIDLVEVGAGGGSPAFALSTIIARSNSLNTPSIWKSAFPAGVLVSTPC
jgi:hypothetical protein